MDKMTREEKLVRLFEMQEHPERFTDDELQAMLDDEDIREDIILMRKMRNTFISEKRKVKSEKFDTPKRHAVFFTLHSSLSKIAAIFIGCILLAGIAYAAIRIVQERTPMPIAEMQTVNVADDNITKTDNVEATNTVAQSDSTITIDNEELATVLNAMSEHYNIKVEFESEQAKHIRLFLVWDKTLPVTEIVAMLNKYERINIELADNTLTVK